MTKKFARLSLALLASLAACGPTTPGSDEPKDDPNTDIQGALNGLPDADVLMTTLDGVPTYIVGELGKVGDMQTDDGNAAEAALHSKLSPVLATMRLTADNLKFRKMNVDEQGNRHFRYNTTHNGLDVVGGDIVVHVDVKGAISGINGTGRGDISDELGKSDVGQQKALDVITSNQAFYNMSAHVDRTVYIRLEDESVHKAYEVTVKGQRGLDPVRDKVYIDLDTGAMVADYPQIHFAENRKVYSANTSTSLPGTVKRTEGQAATSDADVNAAYDGTGATWEAYNKFWGRDSYDNAGAVLISSVHYDKNYCNAYWDSTQMVYGDGDSSQGCAPLARAQDVTAHELTHAVTERESGLNYSGESGGMNEAMSDIFGAFVEAYVDGGKTGTLAVSTNTWLVGEKILPPALRWMCDPAEDGASADYYSTSVGNLDVHYSSGLGNLAFCLLSQGGTHPRGKSSLTVTGIGMDKAIRIMYKAQTDILTSTSKYAAVRTAMEQAATSLGYDAATVNSVSCAWATIGVGTTPSAGCGTGGGGGSGSGSGSGSGGGGTGDGVLTPGTPISGISGAKASQQFWSVAVPAGQSSLVIQISGGTGDADLYVQASNKPTTSSYVCRPYISGNAETCTISNPTAGTYWVMLNGYAAYTGVTLSGTLTASGGGGGGGGGTGDPYLTSGTAVTGLSGATNSATYYRIATTAGKKLTVTISGGTGDADLYVRQGSRPTTSTYTCRPYLTGNAETCTITSTTAGDYYIMLRGYAAFTGVSLKGTVQ